jgi:hypothetical protein
MVGNQAKSVIDNRRRGRHLAQCVKKLGQAMLLREETMANSRRICSDVNWQCFECLTLPAKMNESIFHAFSPSLAHQLEVIGGRDHVDSEICA